MNHKYFITFLLSLGLMTAIVNTAHAVKAYPHPITVTQPDGTTLTIQIHGDEFLNWVTVGNRLVAKGEDGFYYYASFNSDGTKSISRTRAKAETLSISQTSTVRPPESALAAARIKRESTAFLHSLSSSCRGLLIRNPSDRIRDRRLQLFRRLINVINEQV